jgi:hypothetical protein
MSRGSEGSGDAGNLAVELEMEMDLEMDLEMEMDLKEAPLRLLGSQDDSGSVPNPCDCRDCRDCHD